MRERLSQRSKLIYSTPIHFKLIYSKLDVDDIESDVCEMGEVGEVGEMSEL